MHQRLLHTRKNAYAQTSAGLLLRSGIATIGGMRSSAFTWKVRLYRPKMDLGEPTTLSLYVTLVGVR